VTVFRNANRVTVVADIGGTHIQLGHIQGESVDPNVERVSSDRLRCTDPVTTLGQLITDYAQSKQLQIDAVVLGIPGLLDQSRQSITLCNNIRQLEGTGLRDRLSTSLDCPVYLEQDIMLQLLGEWCYGAACNSGAVFGVYFGTGIGTAYLQNGDPFKPGAGTLQAGHIPVSNQGKPCICGNTDCVEAYASGHTLVALSKEFSVPLEQLFLVADNRELKRSLDEFITYQSFLLASVITITEPEMILIGGGIPKMPGYPHTQLQNSVMAHLQKPYPAEHIKICWAKYENSAALYGAVALIDIYDQQTEA